MRPLDIVFKKESISIYNSRNFVRPLDRKLIQAGEGIYNSRNFVRPLDNEPQHKTMQSTIVEILCVL